MTKPNVSVLALLSKALDRAVAKSRRSPWLSGCHRRGPRLFRQLRPVMAAERLSCPPGVKTPDAAEIGRMTTGRPGAVLCT